MKDTPTAQGASRLEADLVPYRSLDIRDCRPMLVFAPHPDDEVFGSGGLLALAVERNIEAHVIVVSDGALAGDAAEREAESLAAANVLGGHTLRGATEFWRLPDRGLQSVADLCDRIMQAIESCGAQWVVAPSPFEVHPDHRAVCRAVVNACRHRQATGNVVQLVFCEIGQPLLPNGLVDISTVIERKMEAMRCFASQQSFQAYAEQVTGLNRYRAYTLGPAVTHAEAYWLVSAESLAGGMESVLADASAQLHLRH